MKIVYFSNFKNVEKSDFETDQSDFEIYVK